MHKNDAIGVIFCLRKKSYNTCLRKGRSILFDVYGLQFPHGL